MCFVYVFVEFRDPRLNVKARKYILLLVFLQSLEHNGVFLLHQVLFEFGVKLINLDINQ